ncbi:MAG TPA: sensor histidine kinase [Cyclobacteriaceae bacterium]|nr:sensor histidine kinase [Cyclobacteriaceae bacterium]HRJ80866.1 sensor histidine kinase [Cyclobacteriaceae bacterium]
MRFSIFIAFVFNAITGMGQDYLDRDSLWQALRNSKRDTNQVMLYIQLGQQYENNNPDSALLLYEQALNLSEQLNYTRGIISYYTNATYVYNLMGRYDTALILNLKSVEIARQFGDPERLAACLGNVGASYMELERHEEALETYLQVVPMYEQLGDRRRLSSIFDNLCIIYFNLNQYPKSIEYGEKSLRLSREINNVFGVISASINLAMPLNKSGQVNKSVQILTEVQALAKKTNHQYAMLVSASNLGDAYIKLGNFQQAKRSYQDALVLARKLNDLVSEVIAMRGLAICQYSEGQITAAESNINQSLKLAMDNNYLSHIGQAYSVLAEISLLKRDFKGNVNYSIKSDSIRTVLLNESVARNIQNVEAKYESRRKEQRIVELQQQAEIKDLTIRQSRLFNYILVGSLLALAVIALLARRTYQQKKRLFEKESQVQAVQIAKLESEKQLLASEAIIKGQEEERGRLAKDLHDGLGGMLSGVKFSLTNMKSNVVLDANSALLFERSLDMLDNSIAELRRVAHNMMPEVLVKFGLTEALKSYCQSVTESGIFKVNFQAVGMDDRIDSGKEIILYRITQELLNNVAKHARATEVLVQLARQNGEVTLTVEDNGSGVDVAVLQHAAGSGWTSIRSRVDYLKGKADIQGAPGQGTSVQIIIPV